MTDCCCFRCAREHVAAEPLPTDQMMFGVVDPRLAIMFLCETCGNKRCPHAADHRHACSGSNAPGQAGSLYESAPVFSAADTSDASLGPGRTPSQKEES